ncbi:MAG TPA: ChbG/HpnK family deacetylase [Candidatus Acidoferrales bacterium]|nr:ChbG/HpnK family deacetylase [Candidatus Acidoferrales bacterium]
MKNLIVNADDLGWTEGVNRGIAESHRKGLVTSTSLLANGPAFASALAVAAANPELGVGVHLNLSDGVPTAKPNEVPGLLNASGELEGGPESLLLRIASRGLELAQVEREWDAQIRKVRDAGINPTHLDGHKHVQMLPGLFEIALRLAKKHSIRAIRVAHEESKLRTLLSSGREQKPGAVLKQGVQARGLKLLARDAREMADHSGLVTTDYFCGIAQTGFLTNEGVERLLKNLPDGSTELMCHPGYADEELRRTSTRLQESRQTELQILTDSRIRKLVATQGIRLISYQLMGEMA